MERLLDPNVHPTRRGPYLAVIRRALSSGSRREIPTPVDFRPAAVLIPIGLGPDGEYLVFTRRTDRVEYHKGQISFPGGAVDPTDRDRVETALRESHEEIGLRPADVEVLGLLDDLAVTRSGFCITPVVGFIRKSPYPFVANPVEVAEILQVPLAWLLHPAHMQTRQLHDERGRPFTDFVFDWHGHVIWGATGRILKGLLDRIRASMVDD